MKVRPDRQAFERSADGFALAPVWTELLADVSTPVGVFPALAGGGPGLLLESVERSERWGRYSFVAGDPAAIVVLDRAGLRIEDPSERLPFEAPETGDARADLVALARSLRAPSVDGLPSLTGGLMGFLSYEAAELLDGHPSPGGDTPRAADRAHAGEDRAVVFDHWRQRMLLVAHVRPGDYGSGAEALEVLAERLSESVAPSLDPLPGSAPAGVDPLGEPNMVDERYREIVSDDEGPHRGRRHLPGRPLPAARVPVHRAEASPSTGDCGSRTRPPTCSSSG